MNQFLIPFAASSHGKIIVQSFLQSNQKIFPNYFEEMRGLSDGSGVPLESIQLLNLENELGAFQNSTFPVDHCTDIYFDDGKHKLFGHNEDGDKLVKDNAFLCHVQITDQNNHTLNDFTAYFYPGYICGLAFAWNADGLVFSENELFPSKILIGGLLNSFLSRETYNAKNIEQVIQILSVSNRAFGFSLNVGSVKDKKIVNIEFSPDAIDVKIIQGNYSHTNLYKHLTTPQSYTDPSSFHRQARIDQLPSVQSAANIRSILGDTNDKQYPIFRNSNPPGFNLFFLFFF